MRKMGKVAMALIVAVLALSMMACNPSGGQTVPEDVGQGVVDAQYVNSYHSLLALLDGVAGINADNYPAGEECRFNIMGTEVGSITVKEYAEESGYVYDAVFEVGSHPGAMATVTIGSNPIDIMVTKDSSNNLYYTCDVNGGASLSVVVLLGGINTTMNLKYDSALNEDGSISIDGKDYTAEKYEAYTALGKALNTAIAALPADIAEAADTISGTDFVKDETVTAENTLGYTGTSGDYDVSFTAVLSEGEWSFDSITVDGKAFTESVVEKINNPDVAPLF